MVGMIWGRFNDGWGYGLRIGSLGDGGNYVIDP
jgi:hypothetical protein